MYGPSNKRRESRKHKTFCYQNVRNITGVDMVLSKNIIDTLEKKEQIIPPPSYIREYVD